MSADRACAATVGTLALALAGAALADDEYPDAAFLEYLGSWEESDADWILLQPGVRVAETRPEAQADEQSADEESREQGDET